MEFDLRQAVLVSFQSERGTRTRSERTKEAQTRAVYYKCDESKVVGGLTGCIIMNRRKIFGAPSEVSIALRKRSRLHKEVRR